MGDIIKKNIIKSEKKSLEEKASERDKHKNTIVHIDNATINNLSKTNLGKDKAISARVNSTTYTKFKKICNARGLTSNSALNMLISDFVLANKHILED